MKIKNPNNQEIIYGDVKEMEFSIDDSNPIIFDILRNKMYSNKIGAICREVASNSRDANREAGLADTPIEIEFTLDDNSLNLGDTCIIFRDYGLGISPDRMENIFVRYAASTKRNTNSQTGGFGLGAKTPFAYTDSFIVRTICELNGDRTEFMYNAIIDKTGKGKMILLYERFTDNPTGTEIIVPIKSEKDKNTFERECYRNTLFWENVNYLGFESDKPNFDVLYEGKGFKIIDNTQSLFSSNEPYIGLIDGIPYPVFPKKYPTGYSEDNAKIVFDLKLDEVTINANRETIQHDFETERNLDKKVEEICDELKELFSDFCNNHTSYLDALKKANYIGSRYSNINNDWGIVAEISKACNLNFNCLLSDYNFNFFFNNETVISRLRLKYHNIYKASNTELETDENGVITKSKFFYESLGYLSASSLERNLYYFDSKKHSVPKNLKIIEDEGIDSFILIKPIKNDDLNENDFKKDLDYLEKLGIPLKKYSEVDASKKKLNYKREESNKIQVIVRKDTLNESTYLEFDKSKNKLYSTYGGEINKKDTCVYVVDTLKNAEEYKYSNDRQKMKVLRLFNNNMQVLVVGKRTYDNYLKPSGFKTILELFEKIDKTSLKPIKEYTKVNKFLNRNIPNFILSKFSYILPKSTENLLEIREKALTFVNEEVLKEADTNIFWNDLKVEDSKFDFEGYLDKFKKTMNEKYPMLLPYLESKGLYGSYSHNCQIDTDCGETIKVVENYLKTIK